VPGVVAAEIPVKGTPSPIITDPTEDAAEIPVKVVVLSDLAVGEPTVLAAEIPVKGTPISIIGVPILVVAETPVSGTVPSVIVPHPF